MWQGGVVIEMCMVIEYESKIFTTSIPQNFHLRTNIYWSSSETPGGILYSRDLFLFYNYYNKEE